MWDGKEMTKSETSSLARTKNLRFVTKSKWELPTKRSKSYWKDVFEELDTGHLKVNQPLFSLLPPPLLNTIPSQSSASIPTTSLPDALKIQSLIREPIVKISPPSPSHNDLDTLPSIEKTSIEYLKTHDVSNFDLNLIQRSESSESVDKIEKPAKMEALPDLPSISKITQLTKISRYVNEFLASTKVKARSTVTPKNYVHPLRSLTPERTYVRTPERSAQSSRASSVERQPTTQSENMSFESLSPKEPAFPPEPPQKHVAFEEPDDESISYQPKIPRQRAPSLGVASAVPSFGKMISSLEYPDSRSSIESADNTSITAESNSPRDSPQDHREVKSKRFLDPPVVQYPSKSIYPDSRTRFFGSVPRKKHETGIKWPKKTILNTIRVLKTMKARAEHKNTTQLRETTLSPSALIVEGHSTLEKSSSSSVDQEAHRYSSESPSPTIPRKITESMSSTSSEDSSKQTIVKKVRLESKKAKFSFHAPLNLDKQQVPLGLEKVSVSIKDLPQIEGMYQRRKNTKCLACLYRWKPGYAPIMRSADYSEGLLSYKSVLADFEKFLTLKMEEKNSRSSPEVQFTKSIEKSDALNEDKTSNQQFNEARGIRDPGHEKPKSHPLEKKMSQGPMRDNLMSTKSFVSTLSLTSDHSKTTSDQEDSDQGPDQMAEGDEIPGTSSKFRAPCHAPLNLKPSMEPLMALKGKKSKSIQSRVNSLEKSLDEGSDEDSDGDDDDDLEETSVPVKVKPDELKKSVKLDDHKSLADDTEAEIDQKELDPKTESDQDTSEGMVQSTVPSLSEEIYYQLNVKIRETEHNPSHSFRPLSPVMSDSEILKIAKKSLADSKPIKDILIQLQKEFSSRLSQKIANDQSFPDHNAQKIEKITNNLLALLVDSKLYLNPEITSSNIQFSSKQKPYCSSQQLRRFLPFKSYNLVAPILGMPEWHPKRWSALKSARSLRSGFKAKRVTTVFEEPSLLSSVSRKTDSAVEFDLIVNPPSLRESLSPADAQKPKKTNPYSTFLSKPRRKAVIWRPLNQRDLEGYDPESTLKNRASRATEKICRNFCDWLRSLGGAHDTIDEEILKDMFETDFSAEACRTLKVCVREMPMVPTVVASTRHCPEAGEVEVTRRQLIRDVDAERRKAKVVGFGSTVPNHLRYEPPSNHTYSKWIHCSNVPDDLETMNFVWKGIRGLESVKGFSNWLKKESKIKVPRALRKSKRKSLERKIS